MNIIFLTGFMGTGKSCVGRILANRLEYRFLDLDDLIVATAGMTIKEIFAVHGESYFRSLETKMLYTLKGTHGVVVSTGGGAVLSTENRSLMHSTGVVVNLTATVAAIQERIAGDGERPLLLVDNPLERITVLLAEREACYADAAIRVDTTAKTEEEVIDEILLSLKKNCCSEEGITVGLGPRSYPIIFGRNNLAELGSLCTGLGLGGCAAVVTNTTVGPFYADRVAESLKAAGFSVHKVELPDGEEYKNSETLNSIYDKLLEYGLDRGAFIVALGGGVIGDMAGFASATFLRGIPFVQVPTTLLAQVDSSVGGKTGINHPCGKNLIGAFYQPRLVLIDVMVLDTLPEREYLSGLAEVIKYGVVLDKNLYVDLSTNVDKLLARDKDFLLAVIKRSCAIKASVVEQDEYEGGVRAVLNFGHTLGHAVESLTGYKAYLHGEAVAIGMAQAANYSACMGYCSKDDAALVVELLKNLHLPVAMPAFSVAAYTEAIAHDKKVRDGSLGFVFNKGIGAYHLGMVADVSQLLKSCGIGA